MATSPSPLYIPGGWGSLPWGGAPAISPRGGGPDISNCTCYGGSEGHEETSKLWSGVLAFVCSLICVGLMAIDVITDRLFGWNKSWIDCKFFPINAATLGLLGYATSVSVESEKPMPGLLDQLAKVTGVVFICISMNHAMPSQGAMDEISAFVTNLFPLGLLVANTFYNVWDQCRTGVVTKFAFQLKVTTIGMASLYALLISHWLTVPATRKRLESLFQSKHKEIVREVESDRTADPKFTTEKLKMYIKKYWLMALTCSPQYSLRASGVSQIVPNLTLFLCGFLLPCLFSYLRQLCQWNCWCKSDYKWSTAAIFFVQLTGMVPSIWVASRRLESTSLIISCRFKDAFRKYVRHVMQTPRDWKNQPISSDYGMFRGFLFHAKNFGAILLMAIHAMLVFISWLLIYVDAIYVGLLGLPCLLFNRCCNDNDDNQEEGGSSILPTASRDEDNHLRSYVLKLDWVDGDEQSIVKKWKGVPEKWIQRGGEKKPSNLKSILESLPRNLESSRLGQQYFLGSFQAVISSDEVLKNCWSLHLMTIARITKAIGRSSDVKRGQMEALMKGVLYEGYKYAKLVDENVTKPSDAALLAAEMVNERLRYRSKRVNLSSIIGSSEARIDRLKRKSSDIVKKYEDLKSPSMLPLKAIAARSMKAVTQVMLIGESDYNYWRSFQVRHLKEALAIVLAECLANLPEAIFRQCSRGSFCSRDSAVKLAAEVLGETEEIRNYLEQTQTKNVQPENFLYLFSV